MKQQLKGIDQNGHQSKPSRRNRLLLAGILGATAWYFTQSPQQAPSHTARQTTTLPNRRTQLLRVLQTRSALEVQDQTIVPAPTTSTLMPFGSELMVRNFPALPTAQTDSSHQITEPRFIDLRAELRRIDALCQIGSLAATDIQMYFEQHGGNYSYRRFQEVTTDILDQDYNIPNSTNENNPSRSDNVRNCISIQFNSLADDLEAQGEIMASRRILAAASPIYDLINL